MKSGIKSVKADLEDNLKSKVLLAAIKLVIIILNDVSMIRSSFSNSLKLKSQILLSSLNTVVRMCVKISLHVIKSTTMWNVEGNN